jgi:hypothetical protein
MPTSTYEPIQSFTTTSVTNTVTFTSIPSTYTDLEIVATAFGNNTSSGDYLRMRVGNGSVDTGTNYSYTDFYASGFSGTMGYGFEANKNFMYVNGFGNMLHGNNASPMAANISIFDYANTTTQKRILIKDYGVRNGGAQDPVIEYFAHSWRSTSAINTIQLYSDIVSWVVGATFTLYGIKAGS